MRLNILEVKNLTKTFVGICALENVSFDIGENSIVGLIGPNGAGKTTLINCLSKFYHLTRGKIVFKGEDITKLKSFQVCSKGMVRTFQLTSLFETESALGNVLIGQHIHVKRNLCNVLTYTNREQEKLARNAAIEKLEFVGMASLADKPVSEISHFGRKSLAIAIALATQPKMLLIDEPVAGLDNEETTKVLDLIRSIRASGVSVLLIEHNVKAVMSLCDKVIVLNFGSKIAEGTPSEIVNNKEVQKSYLGYA
jgi:branched-chain amino acid transport system ATP-binding protein